MLTARREMEKFFDKKGVQLYRAMLDVARHSHKKDWRFTDAVAQLADIIQSTMVLSDLFGRRRTLMEVDRAKSRRGRFAAEDQGTPIVPNVPFDEAVDRIVNAEPRLASSAEEVSRLYSTDRVFAMARSNAQKVTDRIQDEIGKWLNEGKSQDEIENTILNIGKAADAGDVRNWTRGYAATVYRTNGVQAYSTGRFEQAADKDVREVIPSVRLVGPDDDRKRPNHRISLGLAATIEDPIWKTWRPPNGYNSFAPDTRVEGRIDQASKAWYSGPLVQLKTRKGRSLSVTVNHPVLTLRGFVSAGDLRKGDYLVAYGPSVESLVSGSGDDRLSSPLPGGRAIHDKNAPSRIEDVFKACLRERTASTLERFSRAVPLDLHGDGRFCYGDIHIVGADGLLPNDAEPIVPQFSRDPALVSSQWAALLGSHRLGILLTRDYVSLGAGSKLDVSTLDAVGDARARGAVLLAQLKNRFTSEVFLDDLVDVQVSPYTGHVYDLQSPLGYIVANGLIASNCRDGVEFESIYDLQRQGRIKEGKVIPYYPAGIFGTSPDKGFETKTIAF